MIDERGIPKAGKHSIAVYRQYYGNIGKVGNCQVGVYLPSDWIDDPARCDAAGIPKEHQIFKTKAELAHEMIGESKS